MTSEEAIFAEALAKGSVAEQAAYLEVACAGNAQLALLHLARQDEAAYRRVCARLVDRPPLDRSRANAACAIAWSCSLLPDAGVKADEVIGIAERAVAVNAKDPDYLIGLGAALYRAGRFQDAAKTLADAKAAYDREHATPTPGIYVTTTAIYSDLFLAMTHHRLGDHDQAVSSLARAAEAIDAVPSTNESSPQHPWNRRLTLQILRKQAETLITSAAG